MTSFENLQSVGDNIKTLHKMYGVENVLDMEACLKSAVPEEYSSKTEILLEELFYGYNSTILDRLRNIWKSKSNEASKDIQELRKEILKVLEYRKQNTLEYLSQSLKQIQGFLSCKDLTNVHTVDFIIKVLEMEKLPTREQGWFKEISRNIVVGEDGQVKSVTEIFYLLEKTADCEQVSCWHALFSNEEEDNVDEIWTWYGGNPMCIFQLDDENGNAKIISTVINEMSKEHTIKSGVLFGAQIEKGLGDENVFSLVTCKCISAFTLDCYKDPMKDMPKKWENLVQLYIENKQNGNNYIANIIKQLIPSNDLEHFENDVKFKNNTSQKQLLI